MSSNDENKKEKSFSTILPNIQSVEKNKPYNSMIEKLTVESLHHELVRADPKIYSEEARIQRLQFMALLLSCPEFCSKIVMRFGDWFNFAMQESFRQNPAEYFNLTLPIIKTHAIENLFNQLQRAKPDKEFDEAGIQRFQIYRSLFGCTDLSTNIIEGSTARINVSDYPLVKTNNWINHPPLKEYFGNPENHMDPKYDGTKLISFLRFFRNTIAHFLQTGESFRINVLNGESKETKEMSRAAFCEFFDERYPDLLSFLLWLYPSACDNDNEIVQLLRLGSTSEKNENSEKKKLDVLVKKDLVEILLEMINFFFGNSLITKEQIEGIIDENLEFNKSDFSLWDKESEFFLRVKPKEEELQIKECQMINPNKKTGEKKKEQKQKKGKNEKGRKKYYAICRKCPCTCDKNDSDVAKSPELIQEARKKEQIEEKGAKEI